ncbi:MAG: LPS export ABC transporter periplasmic protein LptC [Desulfobulbaceae bacterium]|nr:LPS export ABC transporter periplasmic protein LptC [Desulfobulbaceae bacterium]
MNLRRNSIWLLPLLLTLTGPLWWGAAGWLLGPRSSAVSEAPSGERQLNTFVLRRVALSQARNGVDDLFVEAEQVSSGKVVDALEMLGVAGRMTGQERSVSFTGGTASYDPAGQVLQVDERVTMTTSDGYRLETEALRCLTASRQVESDRPLQLTGPGLKLRGRKFLYSLPSGDFRIGGRVVVDIS